MALRVNILVAEDDLRDQILWDHLLVPPSSIFVHYVWSGAEVVDYLAGKGPFANREKYPYPDVLFLDVEMPRMNGLQVLEWLAANPTVVRPSVYICTGVAASPIRKEIEKHPIDGFFVKPLSPGQLTRILTEKLSA
ncbi:MAG: response regulator with CheY-like receiver domain and winged-helix DNA-binding domain [Verrucomicrobia bacterium]|nr:response regulator with CheY-like receiver domain and winged-helix DNA-binding domain [Verrucomicrobiota bacterium]